MCSLGRASSSRLCFLRPLLPASSAIERAAVYSEESQITEPESRDKIITKTLFGSDSWEVQ
jgi:hypothetical protein